MEALMRRGRYQFRNISNEQKENSAILVDIDGTLLPYADQKFRHSYRCECGHEFNASSLDRTLPVSCPYCTGTSLKRNEPSLGECLSIVREIIERDVPPYQGASECLRKLAGKYAIFYMTARDKSFYKKTEAWLISNQFPYLSPHQLLMRESDNAEVPHRLKARLIEGLSGRMKPATIIDDDLSLIMVARSMGVPFTWAPACWDKNSYYGKLLERL
jgi:DNA-directed RNA polymerase subunit RPC12/RpoP